MVLHWQGGDHTQLQVKQRLNAAGRHNPRIPDDTIRRDLAQQYLDDHRELALLSCTQFDARSLGLEQACLEILGSARHSLVAPFLIRTPESLEAHRPRSVASKEHPGENAVQR
jgi:hypothetical protein